MSLMSRLNERAREEESGYLERTAELAASETALEEDPSPSNEPVDLAAPKPPVEPTGPLDRHEEVSRRATAARSVPVEEGADPDPEEDAPPPSSPSTPPPAETAEQPAPAQFQPSEPEGPAPVAGPQPEGAAEDAPPMGVPEAARAVLMTEQERVSSLVDDRVEGSIGDAGSFEEVLANFPRPSVASQRELLEQKRRRVGNHEIAVPANWPEFMTIPTYAELRALNRPGVTLEEVRDFGGRKQIQADEMEARARELNEWIFAFGDGRQNEKHRRARAKNRDAAIRKRSFDDHGKEVRENRPDPVEITDEELYRDRHYGIRFAVLLNPDPDHLNLLRQAPVAAWGHDTLRTQDGGRIRASDDEIRVTSVSMQAAQLMVMEAKARGWEVLRVSGTNEFCAAVKRACKEQGVGAIITRRGPLGLGPFSRPEVIMPPLPDNLLPRPSGPAETERERKQEAAPEADRDAAAALLDQAGGTAGTPKRGGDLPEPRPDGSDPDRPPTGADPDGEGVRLSVPEAAGSDGPSPAGRPEEDAPVVSGAWVPETRVVVTDPVGPDARPDRSPDAEWTPIQRI